MPELCNEKQQNQPYPHAWAEKSNHTLGNRVCNLKKGVVR